MQKPDLNSHARHAKTSFGVRRIKPTSEDPAVVKRARDHQQTIPCDDPLFDEASTGIYCVLDDRDKQTMLILSIRNVICLLR
jgi:hypothetical protein